MRGFLPAMELQRPASLSEALQMLAAHTGRPFAGGTDLMVVYNAGKLRETRFLDIARLPELQGIRETPEYLDLGALCTFTELLAHPAIHRHFPNLVKSAKATGALAIQNRGTLGGNIANASPAADTPPCLLAYGAELELVSPRGTRVVPYELFHQGYKVMDLAADELVTRIRVPKPSGTSVHYFRKVGTRQAQAIAKLSLALVAQVADGCVANLRIGLGAVAPAPMRACHAEAVLQGQPLANLPVAAALEALLADISPIDDIRSTAHYRSTVTRNLLAQALRTLSATGN